MPAARTTRWARLACLVLCTFAASVVIPDARASEPGSEASAVLTGTLARIAHAGVVRLGYREDAAPFSFVSKAGVPAGYSLELCDALVAALAERIGGHALRTETVRVSAQDRLDQISRGQVDLECGSTTITAARAGQVAFSPTIFITGTKLAVPASSRVRSLDALAKQRVAVVRGTTNEIVLRETLARRALAVELTTTANLAEAFALLEAQRVEAVAGDDILLLGHIVRTGRRKDFAIVGGYLSFDRYALAFARDDPPLQRAIDDTFGALAASGELRRTYNKWFVRTLPGGVRLGLPMGDELRRSFEILGQPPD